MYLGSIEGVVEVGVEVGVGIEEATGEATEVAMADIVHTEGAAGMLSPLFCFLLTRIYRGRGRGF